MNVIEAINTLQGGTVGNAGQNGEPLEFISGCDHYIRCNTPETFERVVGALKSHYPGIRIVRTNPTVILAI